MKLYFLNEFLGDIRDINVDGMWVNGEIIPSNNIDKFNDFFSQHLLMKKMIL
ncbi:hypothetical protein BsIDN1_34730 [Bacillus safensis]|uniref:Uncharacterized protein n=1 Tax=Bacillus safensis TaxID=561879 RepID=A0A5S9MAF6_BACIA|nr:hypothetical protein BsIDN1_34730 [Bacillus safensis]